MQQRGRKERITTFWVWSPINKSLKLGPTQCRCTHRARLYCYIQCTHIEIFPSQISCGHSYSLHLSMSGWVTYSLRKIMCARYYPIVYRYNSSYRNLMIIEGSQCLPQRLSHKPFMIFLNKLQLTHLTLFIINNPLRCLLSSLYNFLQT